MIKKILLLLVFTFTFINCEQSEIIETDSVQILGEWQMYKEENLESIIDQWTGTEWTYVDKWFQNTREDSQIILEFKEDGTFIDRYADVEVANGIWGKLNENNYYFDYVQENNNINESLIDRRLIKFFCDNTYSIEIENNDRVIYYYKKIDTTECSDEITYKVTD
ncbi:hypothetical protein [uncultured Polaribacter sp.]|uniref:hypothetical protein n=1 Tax=uncultured Polaribacter sp. TaxID=174711 RepID=UPI0026032134|nr:hypothetical protein [uncultured Polaribacter sp.]